MTRADQEPTDTEPSDTEPTDTGLTAVHGRTFASLHVRNYALYFWGQSVSIAGTWMQNVALSWLVLQLTHSGTALGIVNGIRFVPILLLGPWGGLLADRMDKRRILLVTQALSGALSGVLGLIVALDLATIGVVYAFAAALGLVNVLANPARQVFVSNMVPAGLLSNAVTLNSVAANVARVVGPLFSGVLIAGIGVATCFFANCLSFVAVILSLLLMDLRRLYPSRPVRRARGQVREGFRYVRHTPEVLLPMIMIAVVGTFAWNFQVTFPLVATDSFGGQAWTYGAMLSCLGVGATAGGLVVARRGEARGGDVAMSALWLGGALLLAALAPNLYAEYAVMLVLGWTTISFNSGAKTALQLASAPHMRGRVMALWAVAWQGTTPIGGPVVGWIGESLGARWSLVAGAVPTLVVAAISLATRSSAPGGDGGEAAAG